MCWDLILPPEVLSNETGTGLRDQTIEIPQTAFYYRPQRSCGQGNIFAPVCHSVHGGGGVYLSASWEGGPQEGSTPLPGKEVLHYRVNKPL